ncbi:MAG: M1 family metallopeptidase [Gammaproteobacteria bacterium]|nr:M1 family metallopeptidase [Gammaproteobacteria bacterium]
MARRLTSRLLPGLLLIAATTFAEEPADYRLPPGTAPVSQSIELRLDPALPSFSGSTVINLKVDQATDKIGIHQVGLTINRISLVGPNACRELNSTVGEWDINWLSDGKEIVPGTYQLQIGFEGKFLEDGEGIYHDSSNDNDYLFTQFEAMHARKAFPVFDEPAFKIPFQLTILAPAGLTVVSNTPVDTESETDGWQRVRFMQTRPLPSYLLAFAVGPFERVPLEGMSVPGNIYTPRGRAGEVGFVTRQTPRILKALEDYFGTTYPYRKLDMIATSKGGFGGAMENAGLVTFSPSLLLVGDKPDGTQALSALSVITHELAHMWYGDLVTMKWWNDLWLNESFATFMEGKIMGELYPQYETQLNLAQAGAFATDQRTTAKRVRRQVTQELEAWEDTNLVYNKGGALLHMAEAYIGPEVFRVAVQDYLKRFAWRNATEADLWAVLSEHSDEDVGAIVSGYLNQPGFATVSIDKNGHISQTRYLSYGRVAPDQLWAIPLNITYKKAGEIGHTTYLLKEKKATLAVLKDADWVFPDAGANGYYRWSIDPEAYHRLIQDQQLLSDREQIGMLDNSSGLLNAGIITAGDYLAVVDKTLESSNPLVFTDALDRLLEVGYDYIDPALSESFAGFVDGAVAGQLKAVGLESRPGDSESVIRMRPRLLRLLGQFGSDPLVPETAHKLALQYLGNPDSMSADLGRDALRVAALHGDMGLFEKYREAFLKSDSETLRNNVAAALYFSNPEIVRAYLEFALSVPAEAVEFRALNGAASLMQDHSLLYEWLRENMAALEARYPESFLTYLPFVMAGYCNESNLKMSKEFFGSRGEVYAPSLLKATETTEDCIERKARERESLETFLSARAK